MNEKKLASRRITQLAKLTNRINHSIGRIHSGRICNNFLKRWNEKNEKTKKRTKGTTSRKGKKKRTKIIELKQN